MNRILVVGLIGLAGALGTLLRYAVALGARSVLGAEFPYGTLLVNLAGCFLIALVSQLAISTPWISPSARTILTTGFMGGLTTYSSFNFEATNLMQERAWGSASAYLGMTVVGCFLAGLLGLMVARRIALA
jgi:CrcB protein